MIVVTREREREDEEKKRKEQNISGGEEKGKNLIMRNKRVTSGKGV